MIALIFLLLLFSSSVQAATYWVSPSGNDGSQHCDDSASLPALANTSRTITQGLGCLASGDTLNILAGTYAESITGGVNLAVSQSGSGSGNNYTAPTTIQAYSSSLVTLQAIHLSTPAPGLAFRYIIFKDLHINAGGAGGGNACVVAGGGNGGGQVDHIKYDGLDITGCDFGMQLGGDDDAGEFLWVTRTNVHDGGRFTSHHCWYIEASDSLIENSTCTNWTGYGIHNYAEGTVSPSRNVYRNNIIGRTGLDTTSVAGGILCRTGTSCTVYNNVLYGSQEGIQVNNSSMNAAIYNNTVYGNGAGFGGACCYPAIIVFGGTATIRNNLVVGNADNSIYTATCSPACTTSNNQFTNPGFVNAAGGNFALTADTSPGADLSAIFQTDITLAQRTVPWSIGAYEYAAVNSVITWNSTTATPATGTACTSPGCSSWSTPQLTLHPGDNPITVTANDGAGNQVTTSIVVTYTPTFTGNTLVASYGLEEVGGSNALDSSGNNNTGTLTNAPKRQAGRYGQGILLDGLSQFIEVPRAGHPSIDFTQSFSFMAWVRPSAIHDDWRPIIVKNYNIYLYASSPGTATCGIGAVVVGFNTLTQNYETCLSTPLPIGVPSFVAGTYDGKTLRLYVNGVLATTTASGIIDPTVNGSPGVTGDVMIGGSGYGEYFDGMVDEVRLYNYALPISGPLNTTYGAACSTAAQAEQNDITTASLIGAANCPVGLLVPPPTIAFGAKATIGFGATNSGIRLGSTP